MASTAPAAVAQSCAATASSQLAAPAASAGLAEGRAALPPLVEICTASHRVLQGPALGGAVHILGGRLQEGGGVCVVLGAVLRFCRPGGEAAAGQRAGAGERQPGGGSACRAAQHGRQARRAAQAREAGRRGAGARSPSAASLSAWRLSRCARSASCSSALPIISARRRCFSSSAARRARHAGRVQAAKGVSWPAVRRAGVFGGEL